MTRNWFERYRKIRKLQTPKSKALFLVGPSMCCWKIGEPSLPLLGRGNWGTVFHASSFKAWRNMVGDGGVGGECWLLRRSWWSLIGQGTNCPGQWCHCNISSVNGLENMYDISFLIAIINLIEEQMIEVAKAAAQPRHTWNPVLAFFFPFFGVSFCYRPSRQQLRRVENIKALRWHQSAIVFPGDGHCPGGVARSLNFKEF